MPELPEVKIEAQWVQACLSRRRILTIEKSPLHRCPLPPLPPPPYQLETEARGKEMKLLLRSSPDLQPVSWLIQLGMSGRFRLQRKILPHAHLRFYLDDAQILQFIDPRRFSRWREGDWSTTRGPDPMTEHEQMENHIRKNIHRAGKRRLCEIMMDQFFFNGIGNYLRAEILYRYPHSPFEAASVTFKNPKRLRQLIDITREVCREAYELGGAQIMTWENPFEMDANPIKDWLRCYGKLEKCRDRCGRTFWHKKKYKTRELA